MNSTSKAIIARDRLLSILELAKREDPLARWDIASGPGDRKQAAIVHYSNGQRVLLTVQET